MPAVHLLREIDGFLDLDGMRENLRPSPSHTDRPSIDPGLIVRMLVIGNEMGIPSERRLSQTAHLDPANRWFSRLGPDDDLSDHSTFSLHRPGKLRESGLLRQIFEATAERCLKEDLVSGEGISVDGSLIPADADEIRSIAAKD